MRTSRPKNAIRAVDRGKAGGPGKPIPARLAVHRLKQGVCDLAGIVIAQADAYGLIAGFDQDL
jgi:hypothetical protein